MELHLIPSAEPSEDERSALDAFFDESGAVFAAQDERSLDGRRVARGGQHARRKRHLLLPALQTVQGRIGHISPGALNHICETLSVPPAEAYGVASFYALLSTKPAPPRVVHVCDDLACRINGARELCLGMEQRFGHAGAPAAGGEATWKTSPCLGLCEQAPVAFVQQAGHDQTEFTVVSATVEKLADVVLGGPSIVPVVGRRQGIPAAPQTADPDKHDLRLLARVGRIDPESLDEYRGAGGYVALRRAFELGPVGILREITESGLQGRGGAAFPTGRKWQAVASSPDKPHFLVANADESESGTFKDRVLLEEDPFAIVEAMTIAGYATGCERGYVYVRGEYPLAAERVQNAIDSATRRGFLGQNIMDEDVSFTIEIRRGAGAYICGEETALFNSIEGFRGEPRNKPPYPAEAGLFGKPTVVNNIETLACVLDILAGGGIAYARKGTDGSKGNKLYCLSGHVERPGVYEVPFGATLRELLDLAGGVPEGRALRAVLLGGAAGSFVTPDEFDVPLTYEGTRAIGASLGSGVIMALDDRTDLTDFVLRIATFFRDESCGQCVPCRVGTQRQEEALLRLASGKTLGTRADEIDLIDDIARVMRDASICGLGPTAPTAVQSAIDKLGLFRDGAVA